MPFTKERVRSRRKSLELTLQDVADKIGVSRQTIQKYETGVITKIDCSVLEKLAEALNTTTNYLLGQPEPAPNTQGVVLSSDETDTLSLYNKLDDVDKAEVRGEMKGMLRAEKYALKNKRRLG